MSKSLAMAPQMPVILCLHASNQKMWLPNAPTHLVDNKLQRSHQTR